MLLTSLGFDAEASVAMFVSRDLASAIIGVYLSCNLDYSSDSTLKLGYVPDWHTVVYTELVWSQDLTRALGTTHMHAVRLEGRVGSTDAKLSSILLLNH